MGAQDTCTQGAGKTSLDWWMLQYSHKTDNDDDCKTSSEVGSDELSYSVLDDDVPMIGSTLPMEVDAGENSYHAPPLNIPSDENIFCEYYEGAAEVFSQDEILYEKILKNDAHRAAREVSGIYYPFSDWAELELAEWLESLPMSRIDEFLRLEYVSISFHEIYIMLIFIRCCVVHYRSPLHRNCVHVLRCSLTRLAGKKKKSEWTAMRLNRP